MKFTRENILVIGILLCLATITSAIAIQKTKLNFQYPPLSSESNQPDGSRAFILWLESVGYPVSISMPGDFTIPDQMDVAFILEPTVKLAEEMPEIHRWVRNGGTLFMVGENNTMLDALQEFNYSYKNVFTNTSNISLTNPEWSNPRITSVANINLKRVLVYQGENSLSQTSSENPQNQDDTLNQPGQPILWSSEGVVAIRSMQDKGQIFLITASELFSNAGLKSPGISQIIQNILSIAFAAKQTTPKIWIDEWHHGNTIVPRQINGPEGWLTQTTIGKSLLLTFGFVFLALLLNGRSFGKPISTKKPQIRRSPLEYVSAIANLNRRAGNRGRVIQIEYEALRKYYSRRYHISLDLSHEEFSKIISLYSPDFDRVQFIQLLEKLSTSMYRSDLSEKMMLELLQDVQEWQNQNSIKKIP